LIDSVARVGGAAQSATDLAAGLPALLAEERAAAIDQLAGVFDEKQGQLLTLAIELRSALEAGGTTSDSVRETAAALDALMARFDRRAAPANGTVPRPFDITEYTEALRQMSDTAQQLQALIGQIDSNAPALTAVSGQATDRLQRLVDHVYWRLVQLALLLVAACVLGALAYRAIVRRSERTVTQS
jgi:methyl-accepting chemotaxis protein